MKGKALSVPWVVARPEVRRDVASGALHFICATEPRARVPATVPLRLERVATGVDRLIRDGTAAREATSQRLLIGSIACALAMFLLGGLWILAAVVVLPLAATSLSRLVSKRYREPVAAFLRDRRREDSRFGAACTRLVAPFLDRHTAVAERTIAGSGATLLVVRSAHGQRGVPCRVPWDEAELFREILAEQGIVVGATREDMHEFLAACALRLDYDALVGRIYVLERDGLSAVGAFVALHREVATDLPLLQHLLSVRGENATMQTLESRLSAARAAQRKEELAADLVSRREGPGLLLTMDIVDAMQPLHFELLLGMIYESLGYVFKPGRGRQDQGSDGLLERAGERTVLQAKLYGPDRTVGNDAVQQVVAARQHYRCQLAMVVTNREFTSSARELAGGTSTRLIGRDELTRLVAEFNAQPKDYACLARLLIPGADTGDLHSALGTAESEAEVGAAEDSTVERR